MSLDFCHSGLSGPQTQDILRGNQTNCLQTSPECYREVSVKRTPESFCKKQQQESSLVLKKKQNFTDFTGYSLSEFASCRVHIHLLSKENWIAV